MESRPNVARLHDQKKILKMLSCYFQVDPHISCPSGTEHASIREQRRNCKHHAPSVPQRIIARPAKQT